jgi:hypothetical protein
MNYFLLFMFVTISLHGAKPLSQDLLQQWKKQLKSVPEQTTWAQATVLERAAVVCALSIDGGPQIFQYWPSKTVSRLTLTNNFWGCFGQGQERLFFFGADVGDLSQFRLLIEEGELSPDNLTVSDVAQLARLIFCTELPLEELPLYPREQVMPGPSPLPAKQLAKRPQQKPSIPPRPASMRLPHAAQEEGAPMLRRSQTVDLRKIAAEQGLAAMVAGSSGSLRRGQSDDSNKQGRRLSLKNRKKQFKHNEDNN